MSDSASGSGGPRPERHRSVIDIIGPRQHQIDRLKEELRPLFASGDEPIVARLAIDMVRTPQGLELIADAPGLEPGDIDVSTIDGCLTIRGEKPCHGLAEGKVECRGECGHGPFERTVDLPEGASVDAITATLSKGVLTVVVPIGPPPEPRRIEVRAD